MNDVSPPLGAKLAPLIARLTSDSDPEVLACVRAIRRLLDARGLDLNDLAAALEPKPAQVVYVEIEPAEPRSWSELARWVVVNDRGRLKAHERAFAEDMAPALGHARGTPNERQAAWLRALYAKLGGEA